MAYNASFKFSPEQLTDIQRINDDVSDHIEDGLTIIHTLQHPNRENGEHKVMYNVSLACQTLKRKRVWHARLVQCMYYALSTWIEVCISQEY